jgi:hypothetical protein
MQSTVLAKAKKKHCGNNIHRSAFSIHKVTTFAWRLIVSSRKRQQITPEIDQKLICFQQ